MCRDLIINNFRVQIFSQSARHCASSRGAKETYAVYDQYRNKVNRLSRDILTDII